jgi:hypothetical protein
MNEILFNSKMGATWLSNFHLSDIEYEGKIYPSIEHLYQAAKYLPDHPEEAEKVRRARTPSGAKALGNVPFGLPKDWDTRRVEIMRHAVRLKFAFGTELAKMLLDTGDDRLVEFAPWGDTFWGVDAEMKGKNTLGVLLMEQRDRLRLQGMSVHHFLYRVPNGHPSRAVPVLREDYPNGRAYLGSLSSPIDDQTLLLGLAGGSFVPLEKPIENWDPDQALWMHTDGSVWYGSPSDPYYAAGEKLYTPELSPYAKYIEAMKEAHPKPAEDIPLKPY